MACLNSISCEHCQECDPLACEDYVPENSRLSSSSMRGGDQPE